ncbi:MAG: CarD family transcriptional regulator [Bacilli bacterium]|nr:CarD family transcriptional regulator [Bacilli bacterium]MDD4808526.1 CarD family transcriptional regulator [Bacilli bacterium]
MFKENDYVVYRRNICRVTGIKHNSKNGKDYYILIPIDDESLTIDVPTQTKYNLIRSLISKAEVEKIINEIPNVGIIKNNNRMMETDYKKLLSTDKHLDLIKIIKTTYLRNDERISSGKKIAEKDDTYFKLAEKKLYNEFSIVLGISYDEAKRYVIDKVSKLLE